MDLSGLGVERNGKHCWPDHPSYGRDRRPISHTFPQSWRGLKTRGFAHWPQLFLAEYGERFRRTAAARVHHHARRGGLVEHVAQMMRTAEAIAGAYPALNRDLLLTAVLFHDSGKLWENALPADGFVMAYDERGEMLGHITIGIELINTLWRKVLALPEAAALGHAPARQ